MQTITPFLWFNTNAKQAADFYLSIFKNSKMLEENSMMVSFELNGQRFIGLNGGPTYTFTEAVSFFVSCDTQEEVDYYWEKLLEGGQESRCGWLKDKFGLSWQIIPKRLGELIGNADRQKADRAMQKMLTMKKIIVKELEDAFEGR